MKSLKNGMYIAELEDNELQLYKIVNIENGEDENNKKDLMISATMLNAPETWKRGENFVFYIHTIKELDIKYKTMSKQKFFKKYMEELI